MAVGIGDWPGVWQLGLTQKREGLQWLKLGLQIESWAEGSIALAQTFSASSAVLVHTELIVRVVGSPMGWGPRGSGFKGSGLNSIPRRVCQW